MSKTVKAPRKRVGDQLMIRFPEGSDLKDRLEVAARVNNRSLSSELIHRLQQSLKASPSGPSVERRINILSEELETLRAQVRGLGTTVNLLAAKVDNKS